MWNLFASKKRSEPEELLRMISLNIPLALHQIRMSPQGQITMPYSSSAISNIYGMTPDQLKNDFLPAIESIHPEDQTHLLYAIEHSRQTLKPIQFECRLNLPNRDEIWVTCKTSPPQTDSDGDIVWYGYFQDITDFKKAEQKRLSDHRIFDNIDRINRAIQGSNNLEQVMSVALESILSIFNCDRSWLIYPCDPTAQNAKVMMALSRPEYSGKLATGLDFSIKSTAAGIMQRCLESDEPIALAPDTGFPLCLNQESDNEVLSILAISLDQAIDKPWILGLDQCSHHRVWSDQDKRLFRKISKRLADGLSTLHITRHLKESEERFRHAFEFAGIGMAIQSINGSWLRVNRSFCDFLGYREEELRRMNHQDLEHPDDFQHSQAELYQLMKGDYPYLQTETRFCHQNGHYLWLKITRSIVFDENKTPLYYVLQIENIDQRRKAEHQIALLSFALNRVRESVFLITKKAEFKYVNDEACQVLGYRRETLLHHMKVPDVDPNYQIDHWNEHWIELKKTGSIVLETCHKTKSGKIIPVEVNANYFEYDGCAYNLALVRDITERKKAEQDRINHLYFFESLDTINRAIQSASSLEQMMGHVLNDMLEILACDRAWLVYPCDPDAEFWHVPMEKNRPEFPGAFSTGANMPMDRDVADTMRLTLANDHPITLGQGNAYSLPVDISIQFNIQSIITVAIYPKTGKPWLFGLHQCSHARVWSDADKMLFGEIARRLTDGLTSLLMSRDLHESEERFRQMAESIQEVFWLTDASKKQLLYVSPAYETIWGRSCDDLYDRPGEWIDAIHFEDRDQVADAVHNHQTSGEYDIEYRIYHTDGTLRHIHERAFPIRDQNGKVYRISGTAQDITDRKEREAYIQFLAYHDSLTGLPNRELIMNLLDQGIAHAHRNNQMLAVLFLDLDRFKTINDTLGHLEGDKLLMQVGKCLSETLREEDIIGRVGGDEFLILLTDLANPEDVAHVTEKIISALSSPFKIADHSLHINASIGISLFPRDATKAETLIKYADSALYLAKEQGRNIFRFFSPDLDAKVRTRLQMENDLRKAIDHNELFLTYQPQINLTTGKCIGAETLLRWHHPLHGIVSPAEFIPIAEETGLIIPMGEWVLRQACLQAKLWQKNGHENFMVSVNLSRKQLDVKDFALKIEAILKATGCDPQLLELEITESSAMNKPEEAIQKLQTLHNLGIQLAIDDFGTGYSSLAYLKRFPFDRLKIDRSFISGIPEDKEDVAIVQLTIMLAQQLNLQIIAEGVETEAQKDYLLEIGCLEMQGYLFSKPVSASELETFCNFN